MTATFISFDKHPKIIFIGCELHYLMLERGKVRKATNLRE